MLIFSLILAVLNSDLCSLGGFEGEKSLSLSCHLPCHTNAWKQECLSASSYWCQRFLCHTKFLTSGRVCVLSCV